MTDDCCPCRTCTAPTELEYEQVVQDSIRSAADDHTDHALLRTTVCANDACHRVVDHRDREAQDDDPAEFHRVRMDAVGTAEQITERI